MAVTVDAIADWQAYAQSAGARYHTQLFSRTHYMDWAKLLADVKAERDKVRNEPR